MNKLYFLIFIFSTSAQAENRQTTTHFVLQNVASFVAHEATHFKVVSAKVTKEVSVAEITLDENCLNSDSGSELTCQNVKVLETRPVVQVTLSYDKEFGAADDLVGYVTLSLPQRVFSNSQLEAIHKNGFRASNIFNVTTKTYNETVRVVDDENTPRCDLEDQTQCPEPVYKEGFVQMLDVSLSYSID